MPWPTMRAFLHDKLPDHVDVDGMLERGRFVDDHGRSWNGDEPYRPHTFVHFHRELREEPEVPFELTVLHEDERIVVVDKPAGVAAHPSMGWDGPDVLGALKAMHVRVATSGAAERQGIVSRLDVGTSGVMIVAKGERAYSVLKRAFREHTVDKVYHALVQGHLDPSSGTIDAPIGRHPSREWKMAIIEGGRESITHYDVIEAMPGACLAEIHLETGRTHQIRVHMAAVGHPCVGDATYGADPVMSARTGLIRQWLHARELGITHPITGEHMVFTSDYPDDLVHALDVLRLP